MELNCVFIGRPMPQVKWYKDGKEVIDLGFPIIRPVNTRCEAILKLSSVKQSVSGHFVCVGDAGIAGKVEGNITLVVGGTFGLVINITNTCGHLRTRKRCLLIMGCSKCSVCM